ncbi:hypothetical protein ACVWWH_000776 [Sinomonas sp. RB5]
MITPLWSGIRPLALAVGLASALLVGSFGDPPARADDSVNPDSPAHLVCIGADHYCYDVTNSGDGQATSSGGSAGSGGSEGGGGGGSAGAASDESRGQSTEPGGSAEPNQSTEPGGSTEPNQSTEPGGSTEPNQSTKPGGSTEPNQSTEPGGSTEPNQSTEPGGSTEPNQSTEPGGSTEPSQPTDGANNKVDSQVPDDERPAVPLPDPPRDCGAEAANVQVACQNRGTMVCGVLAACGAAASPVGAAVAGGLCLAIYNVACINEYRDYDAACRNGGGTPDATWHWYTGPFVWF